MRGWSHQSHLGGLFSSRRWHRAGLPHMPTLQAGHINLPTAKEACKQPGRTERNPSSNCLAKPEARFVRCDGCTAALGTSRPGIDAPWQPSARHARLVTGRREPLDERHATAAACAFSVFDRVSLVRGAHGYDHL